MSDCLEEDTPANRTLLLKAARAYLADHRAAERRQRARTRHRSRTAALPAPEELQEVLHLNDCLDSVERKREELLTRELARLAERMTFPTTIPDDFAGEPVVEHFRARYLEGQRLGERKARQFLASPGLCYFDLEFFKHKGIPVVGHHSRVLTPPSYDEQERSLYGVTRQTQIEFTWSGKSTRASLGDRARRGFEAAEIELGGLHELGRGSVLSELQTHAQYLSARFPWDVHDAAWFILTGTPPWVRVLAFKLPTVTDGPDHGFIRIEMTFHPWVSAASLLRVHKRLRTHLIGPRNRPPKLESLEFFSFVSEHRHRGATWLETMKAWTAGSRRRQNRYPGSDEGAVRRFASHYRDIARQVLKPYRRDASEEPEEKAVRS